MRPKLIGNWAGVAVWWIGCICLSASPAVAIFAGFPSAPAERLIRNTEKYLVEHPGDVEGHYLLGRLHALVYVTKRTQISVIGPPGSWEAGGLPQLPRTYFSSYESQFEKDLPSEKLLVHLNEAVRKLQIAVDARPNDAKNCLGLAYIVEMGASDAVNVDVLPHPMSKASSMDEVDSEELILNLRSDVKSMRQSAINRLQGKLESVAGVLHKHRNHPDVRVKSAVNELLSDYWIDRAIEYYYAAYVRALRDDSKVTSTPFHGLRELISWEAGTAYVKLVEARGVGEIVGIDRLKDIRNTIENYEKLPPCGFVTPIVFSLIDAESICELLAPEKTVQFDINGDNRIDQLSWIRPSTGLLVWDPDNSGKITSGRQLFGSVSWWLFFPDGYRALAILDDDRDGYLKGNELRGLSAWFDRNSNGISDADEVVSLDLLNVNWIAVDAEYGEGELQNGNGIGFSDGKIVSTYDWVVESFTVLQD
jgi:hypothetical protein